MIIERHSEHIYFSVILLVKFAFSKESFSEENSIANNSISTHFNKLHTVGNSTRRKWLDDKNSISSFLPVDINIMNASSESAAVKIKNNSKILKNLYLVAKLLESQSLNEVTKSTRLRIIKSGEPLSLFYFKYCNYLTTVSFVLRSRY